jgi:mono/diheme cytochrome c family protein
MSPNTRFQILTIGAITLFSAFGRIATAQRKPASRKEHEEFIYSVKGPDLFRAHCASCHGRDGKGSGPVAAAWKTKPADVTALAKNNDGKFSALRVRKFISGDDPSLASHGTREMPIWGPSFHLIEEDQDFGGVGLQNLVAY